MHSYYAENKEKLKRGLSQFMRKVRHELHHKGCDFEDIVERVDDFE